MADQKVFDVVAAVVERDGRYLITQRTPWAVFPLYWEFPGGKVERGEDDQTALRREMMEELGARIEVGELIERRRHDYKGFSVDFRVYRCRLLNDDIRAIHVADFRWVLPGEFREYHFPPADEAAIRAIIEGWGKGSSR